MTRKTRIINKLTTITAAEKEQVIIFFANHPNYESCVDWNRKDLVYNDFERVFARAGKSEKNRKRSAKTNPALLFKNQRCKIITQTED